MLDRISCQQTHHRLQSQVGVGGLSGQADFSPQLRVPGQEVKPSANSGAAHLVVRVQIGQDLEDDAVRKSFEESQ